MAIRVASSTPGPDGSYRPQDLAALRQPSTARMARYALEGVAELGSAQGLLACEQVFTSGYPSVRKATLVAACTLDADRRLRHVERGIADDNLAVVRAALREMVRWSLPLPINALEGAAHLRCTEAAFFMALLQTASGLSLWPALHLASFQALATPAVQQELAAATAQFRQGLSVAEVYTAPTPVQWQAIGAWMPLETLAAQSPLRFVMEYYAQRMD